jgi:hypothetical protein
MGSAPAVLPAGPRRVSNVEREERFSKLAGTGGLERGTRGRLRGADEDARLPGGRFGSPGPPRGFSVSDSLDSETARTDAPVPKVREAIDLLKELHACSNRPAVTGKIDVRTEV